MENTENTLTRCGTVIFLEKNKGSKSAGLYPYLYESFDNCIRIMLKNDNPFENTGLRSYDGLQVVVHGAMGRGNVFMVESIEKSFNKNISDEEQLS